MATRITVEQARDRLVLRARDGLPMLAVVGFVVASALSLVLCGSLLGSDTFASPPTGKGAVYLCCLAALGPMALLAPFTQHWEIDATREDIARTTSDGARTQRPLSLVQGVDVREVTGLDDQDGRLVIRFTGGYTWELTGPHAMLAEPAEALRAWVTAQQADQPDEPDQV